MKNLDGSWSGEEPANEVKEVLPDAQRQQMLRAMAEATSEAQTYLHSQKNRWGELYGLQLIKAKLNEMSSTEDAFDYYTSVIDIHRAATLKLKPIRQLRLIARERALQYISVFEGGNSFELKPPTVYGKGQMAPVRGKARSLFAACFADARVRGRSSLIEFEDALALDFEEEELASMTEHLEYDPALFWTCQKKGWVIDNTRTVPDIDIDTAFMLVGTHSWEFGHWFIEFLSKYLVAAQACNLDRIPILIDAGMQKQHEEAVRLLAPASAEVIKLKFGESARVRRLWCASSPYYPPLWEEENETYNWGTIAFYPPTYAPLMNEMSRRLEPGSSNQGGSRRDYLARKPAQHRSLRNYQEIEEIAKSRGFEIVYPQDISFRQQVNLIQNCDFILGPEGSAFYVAFISKPGTKLFIFDHIEPLEEVTLQTNIFEARGISAVVMTGPIVKVHSVRSLSDYEIDAETFVEHLDQWLQEGGRRPDNLTAELRTVSGQP